MIHGRLEGAAAPAAATIVAAVLVGLTGTGVVLARSLQGPGAEFVAGPVSGVSGPPAAPPGDPLRVRIPTIGVDAVLRPLGLNDDRTLQVPPFDEAGWYAGGSRPGEPGPAVVAAHVDSTVGPAVFYRLAELTTGDLVHVDYDGGTVTFAVRESQSFPKSEFPTERVYGPTDGPELRLVTCDGTFDRNARSYRDNLVVWADIVVA